MHSVVKELKEFGIVELGLWCACGGGWKSSGNLERNGRENMINHLWYCCLIASPWTINPCKTVFGCLPRSFSEPSRSTIHRRFVHSLPYLINLVCQTITYCGVSRKKTVTFLMDLQGQTTTDKGYWGEGWEVLRYSSCRSPQASLLYLCHSMHPASCRFLIKQNFSLMPSSTSKAPLTLSSALTPSSSVY